MKKKSKELTLYSTDYTVEFFENGNGYRVQTFRVNSTCSRYVNITDFVIFPEDYNRYKFEIFRVN